jgi:hypothetical protein
MKIYICLIATVLLFSKCRECSRDVNQGERVQIPIVFEDFSVFEINESKAVRIDRTTLKRDTFLLSRLMVAYAAASTNVTLTDRAVTGTYSDYESYLNNSDLILIGRDPFYKDTLSNIVIRKSKAETDKCHKDDPNVQVDEVSFQFKGKTIKKNEQITIRKS